MDNFTDIGSFMLPVLGLVKSVLDDTGLEVCLKRKKENEKKKKKKGSAVVRALASHQCGSDSNPGVDPICGLRLLLILSLAPRSFSPGTPVSPLLKKFQFDLERTNTFQRVLIHS